jgi:hypothetical protein
MAHVPDGTLRRLVDEPLAVPDAQIRHLGRCGRCRARRQLITEDAGSAQRLMSRPLLVPDTDEAWASFQGRLEEPEWSKSATMRLPRHRRWHLMGASLSTGATVATVGVVVAGVAAAATLTTVFAPTKVAPLPVSRGDLRALADLAGLGHGSVLGGFTGASGSRALPFGTLSWNADGKGQHVASLSDAEAATGLSLTLPTSLPAGVGSPQSFVVDRSVHATIAWGASAGSALDGSTLNITLGPAIFVQYGGSSGGAGAPPLAIMTMERPMATSTGATIGQLEAFLLSQPSVPPDLAQEIRLLGDLSSTLPVPTPPGAVETSTQVAGSPAVLITDSSGAASGVIWEDQHGFVHTVAGLLDKEDVLSVANQVG